MRLAAFIRANIKPIVAEWERFAATLEPEERFSPEVLRNDIVRMLADIAENMDQEQSAEGAIVEHVISRVKMGLSPRQFLSEFRVLRATIIRLWQQQTNEDGNVALQDMIRFNEAIDQILTEGTVNYSREIDRSRELFLGILGHDLRNPLGAITGLAGLQLRASSPERHARYSSQILVSAQRMTRIINDLLDLARVRLGSGITLHKSATSIHHICQSVIEEMQAIHPDRVFQLTGDDELPGEWDESRLNQVVSNLVGNAVQHGAEDSVITITARGSADGVEVAVHNQGVPIPPERIPKLFDSFYQLDDGNADAGSTSLGLGLYISEEIIAAHEGTIGVQSSAEEGTTFTVRLPGSTGASDSR